MAPAVYLAGTTTLRVIGWRLVKSIKIKINIINPSSKHRFIFYIRTWIKT
jgi:hypothetical protein